MRRFRFKVPGDDGRPITFPPVGPFWETGWTFDHDWTFVVAYAPSVEVLTNGDHWPDAEDIDDQGEQEIVFTGRFECPEWWDAGDASASKVVDLCEALKRSLKGATP